MLEQNISIDKLVEVLQRVKSRDGIETITTFELLHILPSDEAVEHTLAPDVCPACEGTGIDPNDNDLYCQPCGGMGRRNAGKA